MFTSLAKAASVGVFFFSIANAASLERRDNLTPAITTDFPDPSIIKVGNTWYAFGSQSGYDFKNIKVQLATSTDFKTWTLTGKDALGDMGPWAVDNGAVWAPSVSQLDDGTFLMYYSATTNTAGNGRFHCVGTATSKNPEGPYTSISNEPFACPTDQGGALDASFFQDVDGTNYALYKIDANSMGHGGLCGNGVAPIVETPIMIQKVGADGTTKIGDPVELIHNTDRDGPLVEAPYMVRTKAGIYVLYFSSNCYTSADYDVSYATSTSPTGPFQKTTTPLFVTGVKGMIGPGGASVATDGVSMALHGYADQSKVGNVRSFYVTTVGYQDKNVLLS